MTKIYRNAAAVVSMLFILTHLVAVHAETSESSQNGSPATSTSVKGAPGSTPGDSGIAHAAKAAGHGIQRGAKAVVRGIGHGASAVGRAIGHAAAKAGPAKPSPQESDK